MSPQDLTQVLCQLNEKVPPHPDPNLVLSFETSDDAGIYKISDDIALVQTVDFFTPVVDDPFDYGRIAACNALSDVYAMGGTPITAMNIVCYPCSIGHETLAEILRGGAQILVQAGCCLVGGHSITDKEPKYGMSVTGIVHPSKVVTNSGAQPGDALVLTKPLGVGVITTALKFDQISYEGAAEAIRQMSTLNRDASALMVELGASACTDVTGFGLIGHGSEMGIPSGLTLTIDSRRVPVLDGVEDLVRADAVPGGARENLAYFEERVRFGPDVSDEMRLILADPQTSGGLLIALSAERAETLVRRLREMGHGYTSVIGRVDRRSEGGPVVVVE